MWDRKLWDERRKHVPPPGIPWDDLVEETAQSKAPSLYHLTYANSHARRELEFDCVTRGTQIKEVPNSKRCFYKRMEQVVGASEGKETFYVYAEWSISGAVHGRPISEDELRKKGVKL